MGSFVRWTSSTAASALGSLPGVVRGFTGCVGFRTRAFGFSGLPWVGLLPVCEFVAVFLFQVSEIRARIFRALREEGFRGIGRGCRS